MAKTPVRYSPEIAARICSELEKGRTLRSVCRDPGMPDESSVRDWANNDELDFGPHYAKARDKGLDAMAEELLEIADRDADDAETPQAIQRARLKVDTRKWYLAKLAPKRYSDRLDIGNADDKPFVVDDGGRADQLAKLLAKLQSRASGTDDSELV